MDPRVYPSPSHGVTETSRPSWLSLGARDLSSSPCTASTLPTELIFQHRKTIFYSLGLMKYQLYAYSPVGSLCSANAKDSSSLYHEHRDRSFSKRGNRKGKAAFQPKPLFLAFLPHPSTFCLYRAQKACSRNLQWTQRGPGPAPWRRRASSTMVRMWSELLGTPWSGQDIYCSWCTERDSWDGEQRIEKHTFIEHLLRP